MTTETEVEWEEITDIADLKVGDEIEYIVSSNYYESRHWGKVTYINGVAAHTDDWHVTPASLNPKGFVASLKRKVVDPVYPTEVGSVIAYEREVVNGLVDVVTYVRINDRADKAVWVKASNGERWAEWELELIHVHDTLTVVSDGT